MREQLYNMLLCDGRNSQELRVSPSLTERGMP